MLQSALYSPMILGPTQSLDQYVASVVSDIAAAWGSSYPIYLDMNRHGPEQLDRHERHIVEHLFACARQRRLQAVPVAGTDRGAGIAWTRPRSSPATEGLEPAEEPPPLQSA